jgi:hypothetical protein
VNQRIPPRFALLLALSLGGLAACEIITSTDESKLPDATATPEADGGTTGDASDGDSGADGGG